MKIFTFALIVVCCVVGLAGSAIPEEPAQVRALNDLLAYVYQNEILCYDIQWVAEAFERFNSKRTWENLQAARAALWIARRDIERLSIPQPEMTSADRIAMMTRGADLSFMSNLATEFKAEQITALNTFVNLNTAIMYDVFLRTDWDICMSNIRILKQQLECNMQYTANITDLALTVINDKQAAKKFRTLLDEHCPNILAHMNTATMSQEKLEEAINKILNRMEELAVKNSEIISAANYRLDFMRDVLKNNDLHKLAEDLTEISGMPDILPYPAWFTAKNYECAYYWREKDGSLRSPKAGTQLQGVPDVLRIRTSGISLEAVQEYTRELKNLGLTFNGTSNDNEVVCQYGESCFTISWKDDTATILFIESPACIVPRWYIPVKRLTFR